MPLIIFRLAVSSVSSLEYMKEKEMQLFSFTLNLSVYTFENPNFCIVSLCILHLEQALDLNNLSPVPHKAYKTALGLCGLADNLKVRADFRACSPPRIPAFISFWASMDF